MFYIITIVLFLMFLGIYCYLEKINNFKWATILKVALSFSVAVISWVGYFLLKEKGVSILIPIGLSFAVPADYFLQYMHKSIKLYRCGIISFAFMHISLLIMFFNVFGFHILELIIASIFLWVLSLVQTVEHWDPLGDVRIELSIYTVLVTVMSAKAVSIFFLNMSLSPLILAIGGLLFFVSDFFLGEWGYKQEKYLYLFLNRSIYFIGQLAFAFYLFL